MAGDPGVEGARQRDRRTTAGGRLAADCSAVRFEGVPPLNANRLDQVVPTMRPVGGDQLEASSRGCAGSPQSPQCLSGGLYLKSKQAFGLGFFGLGRYWWVGFIENRLQDTFRWWGPM